MSAEGWLAGIARRSKSRLPMEEIASGEVSVDGGLAGDCKGARFPLRQITILAKEDWEAAAMQAGCIHLPWTARRANLLVAGVRLPRGAGSIIAVGVVRLEVTGETSPCELMERTWPGLRRALAPGWRGGVTCRVIDGGPIRPGDAVSVLTEIERHRPRLPG